MHKHCLCFSEKDMESRLNQKLFAAHLLGVLHYILETDKCQCTS